MDVPVSSRIGVLVDKTADSLDIDDCSLKI